MKKIHLCAKYMNSFFNQYLALQKGLSSNTILAYRDTMKLLLCFASEYLKKTIDSLSIENIDEKLILQFLDYIENKRGCSPSTRNARLAAIKAFFLFIGRQEVTLLDQVSKIRSIPLKRTQHKTVDYLDESEIKAIFNSVDPDARNGLRDKALLLFLYNTGARVSEIAGVKINDLRLDLSGQVKLLGKGNKQRACPLWPETVTAIKEYIACRNPQNLNETILFLNSNGIAITRFGIRHITKRYASVAALKCSSIANKKVGPHTFRHSTAMHLLRAGNDINVVCDWLGHSNINTTHIYVEIDMAMKRKILKITPAPKFKNKTKKWNEGSILKWLNNLSRVPELCAGEI